MMKLQMLTQRHDKTKTQLIWVPVNKIRETYVMKRSVSPKARAWIKNNIRERGLRDALEVTPSKVRGVWDLMDGSLRKGILMELFKAHEPVIYRPTRQRITEGKVPVIASLTPLSPYEAYLDALRDNIDRRTVSRLQVGKFVELLLGNEKLPWRSAERHERILQIGADMDLGKSYIYDCLACVTDAPPEAVKDAEKGKMSMKALRSIRGLVGRPREQRFLTEKVRSGIDDKHAARLAAILEGIPPGELTNARMEDVVKKLADAPGMGMVDITTMPFIKDAETAITVVVALKCPKGHNFTHILCPTCLEEQIKDKPSCAACPACNNQTELSKMTPRVHITMDQKELDRRLKSFAEREYPQP